MQINRRLLQLLLATIVVLTSCQGGKKDQQGFTGVEAKIDSLISLMTIEEKVGMIHASSSFTNGGVPRLGIPELVTSDGPHGVRHEHGRDWDKDENVYDSGTYLPTGTALAAHGIRNWVISLVKCWGQRLNSGEKISSLGLGSILSGHLLTDGILST